MPSKRLYVLVALLIALVPFATFGPMFMFMAPGSRGGVYAGGVGTVLGWVTFETSMQRVMLEYEGDRTKISRVTKIVR